MCILRDGKGRRDAAIIISLTTKNQKKDAHLGWDWVGLGLRWGGVEWKGYNYFKYKTEKVSTFISKTSPAALEVSTLRVRGHSSAKTSQILALKNVITRKIGKWGAKRFCNLGHDFLLN